MDRDQWREAIVSHTPSREAKALAHTFLRRWDSASKPLLLESTEDGHNLEFVVKGLQVGRTLVNDHVVARLGRLLEGPTGRAALVEVPQALIDAEPKMSHMQAGVSHGCEFIPRCTERESVSHTDVPENRPRFARLAVLYGWTAAADEQFIYENASPNLVHSVDHGHFFKGPDWTEASLSTLPEVALSPLLTAACQFTPEELTDALARLSSVVDDALAETVAGPPDDWGLSTAERVTLAIFLAERRDKLVADGIP